MPYSTIGPQKNPCIPPADRTSAAWLENPDGSKPSAFRTTQEDADTMSAAVKSKTPPSSKDAREYQGKLETVGVDDSLVTFWSHRK
jgi:hypothetical protein